MRTTLQFFRYLILTFTVFALSCSKDDNKAVLSVKNLIVNFDENPDSGDIIGTIQASGNGTLSFSITTQSPSGAVAINSSTGELTVNNASLFDYETNPLITATISVIDESNTETASVAINLNDLEAIAALLSDSAAAYTSASDGDWIIITESEYNSLASSLSGLSKSGTTDDEYNDVSTNNGTNNGDWTVSNITTTATIPSGDYLVAFKYHVLSATNTTGARVKQSSTSNLSGYSGVGNPLPVHSGSDEVLYFVLKGSNSPTTAEGYLGLYKPAGTTIVGKNLAGNNQYGFQNGDVATLGSTFGGFKFLYQGLSVSKKQW